MNNKEIAKKLYMLACDLDYIDYLENYENDINDIYQALQAIEKSRNISYWNTFYKCIEDIANFN